MGNEFETDALLDGLTGKELENITHVFDSISKGIDVKKANKKSGKYHIYEDFFNRELENSRKDLIDGAVKHKFDNEKWYPVDNFMGLLKSRALDQGILKQHVDDHFKEWAMRKKPELLIDFQVWDGVDHIEQMVKCLNIKNIDTDLAVELVKQWSANVFRRIYNCKVQNTLLLLQGDQGIGKDTWIDKMCSGFDMYFAEMPVSDNEKNNYETMSQTIIANLSEFDKYSKMNTSIIKNMITIPFANFRAAYQRSAALVEFHCSFISSCNTHDILRDPTGNRRFMILELGGINWDFKDIDSKQILAQMKHLYKSKYVPSTISLKKMSEYLEGKKPDNPRQVMFDLYDERIAELYKNRRRSGDPSIWFSIKEVQHILTDLARFTQNSVQYVSYHLAINGYKKRSSNGVRYCIKNMGAIDSVESNVIPIKG